MEYFFVKPEKVDFENSLHLPVFLSNTAFLRNFYIFINRCFGMFLFLRICSVSLFFVVFFHSWETIIQEFKSYNYFQKHTPTKWLFLYKRVSSEKIRFHTSTKITYKQPPPLPPVCQSINNRKDLQSSLYLAEANENYPKELWIKKSIWLYSLFFAITNTFSEH